MCPWRRLPQGLITTKAGLKGDHKGPNFVKRQITIMTIEDWHAALDDLALTSKPSLHLPWTVRRANLVTLGLRLPRGRRAILRVGDLEIRANHCVLPVVEWTRHVTDCERRCIQTARRSCVLSIKWGSDQLAKRSQCAASPA